MALTRDECCLFSEISGYLRDDLVSTGWSDRDAGEILNWFSPRQSEYLQRIDAWQKLLCKGASYNMSGFPNVLYRKGILRVTSFGSVSVMDADPFLVREVHQLAKLFYKFRGEPRKKTDMAAVADRLAHPGRMLLEPHEIEACRAKLSCLAPPSSWESVVGRFGPGITADGCTEREKWNFDGLMPSSVPITAFMCNLHDYEDFDKIGSYRYGMTKIAEVPKSLKANRIISSEPAMGMFVQRGVGRVLSEELHRNFPHNISLHDQARHNSMLHKKDACSIDLSDASDHVSRRLVTLLLPHWKQFLFSVRSQFTIFPSGSIVPLRTFAPMGSGVCFEVLTAVSAALLSYAADVLKKENPRYANVPAWALWRAYGDDWIVVRDLYDIVIDLATRAGLVVNYDKSCCTGAYVESCGCELFKTSDGLRAMRPDYPLELDITPVYVRDDYQNWDASSTIRAAEIFGDVLGWRSTREFLLREAPKPKLRWNKFLQRWEVGRIVRVPRGRRPLPGWPGIRRFFSLSARSNLVSDWATRIEAKLLYEDIALFPAWYHTR